MRFEQIDGEWFAMSSKATARALRERRQFQKEVRAEAIEARHASGFRSAPSARLCCTFLTARRFTLTTPRRPNGGGATARRCEESTGATTRAIDHA